MLQWSNSMWTMLLLNLTALCYLSILTRHLLFAMLCFASAVVVIVTHTTTAGLVKPEHVFATAAEWCSLGISFLSTCLVGAYLLSLATISAFITGMRGLVKCSSWSRAFHPNTWWLLAKGSSVAHMPLSRRTQFDRYSDL
jgi:hypothetical protein